MKVFFDSNIILKLDNFKFCPFSEITSLGHTSVIHQSVQRECKYLKNSIKDQLFDKKKLIFFSSQFPNYKFDHFVLSTDFNLADSILTMDKRLSYLAYKKQVNVFTIHQNKQIILYGGQISFQDFSILL
jgi:rRNA-processing protein FCF1